MDKKRSILNVSVSIAFKLVLLILSLLSRRYLIRYIGNDVNGLNSLYVSIMGILSVADLGVGTAISFSMYAPIVKGDQDKVSALYQLFQKAYLLIGGIILLAGFLLMPFLPLMAKDYVNIQQNMYLTFGLVLLSTVLTYCFSFKISLINAYKDNYITTTIDSSGQIFQYVLQIVVIVLTRSFILYLICKIVAVLAEWAVTNLVFSKKYSTRLKKDAVLDEETKTEVTKNVKAMFLHKIGAVLANSFDSIIISTFIGIVLLGKYSNYAAIMSAMFSTLVLFFTPLTSIIGHLYAKEDKNEIVGYFRFFYGVNYVLGCIFFLGYYCVIDDLIFLILGANLALSRTVSLVITVNYFTQFMRQSVLLFRDATGVFYYDRWKPLAEGLFNIVLSVLLVLVFPEEYKIVGVIVATIITNLLICHTVEPFVLYRHAFNRSVRPYYGMNYGYQFLFFLCVIGISFVDFQLPNIYVDLLAKGCLAVGVSLLPVAIQCLYNKDFLVHLKDMVRNRSRQDIA
ncbi:MAG: hypothetical protein IKQ96_02340 [Lachnospiraceae bacterium]|nr:hypothetical protein [Lachnospiraceae bacterium]